MSTNQYPGEPQQKKSGAGGCLKAAGIGCLVIVVIAVGLGIWGYSAMRKNPIFRQGFERAQVMGLCAANLQAIGSALNRYSAEHSGKYPAKLDDLCPKYILDKSKLQCPQSKPGGVAFCYEYTQPSPSAPDTSIIVTCRYHIIVDGQPAVPIRLMKNGEIDSQNRPISNPNPSQAQPPPRSQPPTKP